MVARCPTRGPSPRQRGRVWRPLAPRSGVVYCVYANTGAGDPINYATPIAVTASTSFTLPAATGNWKYAVRALGDFGLEHNLDAAVSIAISPAGADQSGLPAAPRALRAFPLGPSSLRVEWAWQGSTPPTGFHVYAGQVSPLAYATPAVVVPLGAGYMGTVWCDLTGLAAGAWIIGVRAYNTAGEEANNQTVATSLPTASPGVVDLLTAAGV